MYKKIQINTGKVLLVLFGTAGSRFVVRSMPWSYILLLLSLYKCSGTSTGTSTGTGFDPARAKNLSLAFLDTSHIVLQERLIKCPRAPTTAGVMALLS